jgi:hypothetical protein
LIKASDWCGGERGIYFSPKAHTKIIHRILVCAGRTAQ